MISTLQAQEWPHYNVLRTAWNDAWKPVSCMISFSDAWYTVLPCIISLTSLWPIVTARLVHHSVVMNVTWQCFDQWKEWLVARHTTINDIAVPYRCSACIAGAKFYCPPTCPCWQQQVHLERTLEFCCSPVTYGAHYTNDARLQVEHSNMLSRGWHVITRAPLNIDIALLLSLQ